MTKVQDETQQTVKRMEALSANILRGRQSVRATFRLPSDVIALLSAAASQLGLKQKSLFDQLVENQDTLEQLAQDVPPAKAQKEQKVPRQQKTYVVSRSALFSLDQVSKACGLPRDILVELSIQRLVPMLDEEQEKHRKRSELLSSVKALWKKCELLRYNAEDMLGEDDPATRRLMQLQTTCRQVLESLTELVDQGKAFERYQETWGEEEK